jgi:tetratricopeptide (TPR) repeat protein/tRNA A-37 threonylcarbamoyl transferase component Bud32
VSQQVRDQLQKTLGAAYTLERELTGGGMSRVFVAEETRLKRKVVVKLLSPELAQGISIERFEREIQTAAALQQANIVPVLSAGDMGGLPYYTMPFVEGESLRARLARGPLAIGEVISVLRDIARALAYAHSRGVVHRDIKPDNVLLSGGAAVVTDFGIAKAISASRTQGSGATLTSIGTSIGTPAYMAPEQAAGDPDIDHRADIYALGAMAYELLSGQAVFANRTPQRMLAAHMSEQPEDISLKRPDTPVALGELVMRCLAKEATSRPQSGGEVALALETTSGSGIQSMPPVLLGGPAMFRKALAIYAAAFVVVAVLAKAAIVGIGLPDWVFPGSLIVMALGLPVVLWTGYVQRVARRAMTATPTYTPGGSPAMGQGTIATMALRAAPKMSWYRTAKGGAYALGTFIVLIAVAMGMREAGIGPFKTLRAEGVLTGRDRIIISDFAVSNADSSLGRVVGDAIRAGLGDSRVFTIVSAGEIGASLTRMQKSPTAPVPLVVAQQIAMREGVKAIVDGNVTKVESSYIVVVRLVTADSARELASFRGTASNSDAIIGVADDLSRKLRAKAGESLKRVQATPLLAYASTSSLEALKKYSEAARANDVERDFPKAIRLLREAVQLDSTFGEAWRKLAVALRNSRSYAPSVGDSAIRKAFALSGRMTERERDAVLGYYYSQAPGYDREKAVQAYQRMLARGDSVVALVNLGVLYNQRREYAKAESMYVSAIRIQPANQTPYTNLAFPLAGQGRMSAIDTLISELRTRFPGASAIGQGTISVAQWDGRIDDALTLLDSARKNRDPRAPTFAQGSTTDMYFFSGRIRDAQASQWQHYAIDSTRGVPHPRWLSAMSVVDRTLAAGLPADAEIKALESALQAVNLESRPLQDRPYLALATTYAAAGRVDVARQYIARYDAAVASDTALRRWNIPDYKLAQSRIAEAERKWSDAARLAREADRRPDGPVNDRDEQLPSSLMRIYSAAGNADSVIGAYESYRSQPWGGRTRRGPDIAMDPALIEAAAKAYESKGNTARAVELYRDFVEAWKKADPELQPRVAAAKERLKALGPVEARPKN